MKNQKNPIIGIGIIVGFISMAGAIFALSRTDQGKKAGKKVSDNAAKYAGKATDIVGEYAETKRHGKPAEPSEFARYLYETWGQIKGRGREIEHIDVHLEDGSSYRLKADHLAENVKKELIGRSEHL